MNTLSRAILAMSAAISVQAADLTRPVTGPNSFLNLPGADPKPGAVPPPAAPPKPAAPAVPAKAVPKVVKTPEDLLRDMPMGTGLYAAGQPNPAGLGKANAAFAKNSRGRPVEIQIAVASAGPLYDDTGRYLVSSSVAPYRHRLDDIGVKVEVILMRAQKELRGKFKHGSVVALTGTVGGVEFRAIQGRVMLVLIVHDPVVL